MPKNHECTLSSKHIPHISGLPKLAPNTCWLRRCLRFIRQQFLMSHNHYKCERYFRSKPSVLAEKKRHAKGPHYFVIHPLSAFNLFLELAFFILWSYSLIVEPLIIFMKEISAVWWFSEETLSSVRILFILLFFNLGYIDTKTKSVVLDPRKIIARYLKTYFVFDFLSTYYSIQPFSYLVVDEVMGFQIKLAAYITRTLATCARLNTLLGFMNDWLSSLRCRRVTRYVLRYAVRTYIYLHISAFLLYLVPKLVYAGGSTPSSSWLVQANEAKKKSMSAALKYFECWLMASCYFFGMSPKYDLFVLNEQICFILVTLFGRLYTLFLVGDVLNLLGITSLSQSAYESRLSTLMRYMADNELPEAMKQRMLKYCAFKFRGRYFVEKDILDTLSENIRDEMTLFSARHLIGKMEMFRSMSSFSLNAVLSAMSARYYSPGDVVIKVGAAVDEIFFISSGTVSIADSSGVELCHLEDGEVFGASCLLLERQIYGIVTVEATEVYVIDKRRLLKLLHPYPNLAKGLYDMAKRRLDELRILGQQQAAKTDVLSQLRRGKILEGLTRKVVAR